MKKYGVNWLLYGLGMLVVVGTFLCFVNFIMDTFYPPKRGLLGGARVAGWVVTAFLQAGFAVAIGWSRAKHRESAALATENKPWQGQTEADIMPENVGLFLAEPRRKMFGLICLIVGILTASAQVYTGRLSVAQVIGYTLGVPACFVFGMYLMARARGTTNHRAKVNVVSYPSVKTGAISAHTTDVPVSVAEHDIPTVQVQAR